MTETQNENSFYKLFENLQSEMANKNGRNFIGRTVVKDAEELKHFINILKENATEEDKKDLEQTIETLETNNNEELNIIANALKENASEEDKNKLNELIENTLMENATEEDKKKLDLIMEIIGTNIFRYEFTKENENGKIEKYEYSFHKDRMIVITRDENNKIIKEPIEFEYGKKEYSYKFFCDIIDNLSENLEEDSIFFTKNKYNSSIANTVLRYYIKNNIEEHKYIEDTIITYIIEKHLTYSNTLVKAFIEAGIDNGMFITFDYIRGSNALIANIAGIAESAIIGDNADSIHSLEERGVNFKTFETLKTACSRNNTNIFNYLINEYVENQNILKDRLIILFENIHHPQFAKKVLDTLTEIGYDIYALYQYASRPIHCVAKSNNTEFMKFLLKKMSEKLNKEEMEKIINERDKDGNTALINAVKNGNIEMIKLLLSQPGIEKGINIQDNAGEDVIFHTIKNGNIEIVKLFFQKFKKIDINRKNNKNKTALFYALENKNIDLFNHLLSLEPEIKNSIIDNNKDDIFYVITKKYINIDKIPEEYYCEFLKYTIENNNFDMFKTFIENKNITEETIKNLIPHIIKSLNSEILEFVIEKYDNLDLNEEVRHPIFNKMIKPIVYVFENLSERFFSNYYFPFISEEKEKYNKIINILLKTEKIDIDLEYKIRREKLFDYIVFYRKQGLINDENNKIILEKIKNIYVENKENKTLLDYFIIEEKNLDMIREMFISHPYIDINRKNSKGKSPFDYAIETENMEIITFLLSKRMDYITNKIEDTKSKKDEIKKQKEILNKVMKNPYVKGLNDNNNFKKNLNLAIEHWNNVLNDDLKPKKDNRCNIF